MRICLCRPRLRLHFCLEDNAMVAALIGATGKDYQIGRMTEWMKSSAPFMFQNEHKQFVMFKL